MEAILAEWQEYAQSIPAGRELNTEALRDEAEVILKAIAEDMRQAQTSEEQTAKSKGDKAPTPGVTAAERHAGERRGTGFSLDDLVSEYRALRASVIRLWTRDMTSANRDTLYELTRFNEAIDEALTQSIARYSRQLDRSRELFLGVLGHDLRSPLGAVSNAAQFLLDSDSLSGSQTKAAAHISRGALRLQQMISDLLDVARTRLGEKLPVECRQMDLAELCQQVVQEKRAYHPDSHVTFSETGALPGFWDEQRLAQMLSNLVENGIRHGMEGRPVSVTVNADDGTVVLSVHNEGNPIPEAARSRIFEPMSRGEHDPADRRKTGSLGLGLYIARAIAEAHGGSIDFRSSQEQGTTFEVRLPRGTQLEHTGPG